MENNICDFEIKVIKANDALGFTIMSIAPEYGNPKDKYRKLLFYGDNDVFHALWDLAVASNKLIEYLTGVRDDGCCDSAINRRCGLPMVTWSCSLGVNGEVNFLMLSLLKISPKKLEYVNFELDLVTFPMSKEDIIGSTRRLVDFAVMASRTLYTPGMIETQN